MSDQPNPTKDGLDASSVRVEMFLLFFAAIVLAGIIGEACTEPTTITVLPSTRPQTIVLKSTLNLVWQSFVSAGIAGEFIAGIFAILIMRKRIALDNREIAELNKLVSEANQRAAEATKQTESLRLEVVTANERTAEANKLAAEAQERSTNIAWRLRGFGFHGSVRKAVAECARKYPDEKIDIFMSGSFDLDLFEYFWQLGRWETGKWQVIPRHTFVDICVTVRKGASEHTREVAQAVGDALLFPYKAAVLEFADKDGIDAPFAYGADLTPESAAQWANRSTSPYDIRLWIGRQMSEDLGVRPPFPPFDEPKETILIPESPPPTSDSPASLQ